MVFVKIALVGIAIAATLVVAKQQHVFQRIGVVGTCRVIAAPSGDAAQWWECKQGVLTGFPTLERDSCDHVGVFAHRERWRCPVPIESAPTF